MAVIIYHSKIDPETGELTFDRDDFETIKQLSLVLLDKDPFGWATTVLKDTNNRDKDFVTKFVEGAGLSYDNLSKVADWFPAYYTSFLMEASNAISGLGFEEFQKRMKEELDKLQKGLGAAVDKMPKLTKDTKIGELSDILNPLTRINSLLICYC